MPFGITACEPGTTSYPVGRVFISIDDKKFSRGKIFEKLLHVFWEFL
ncbi:hypothetical protein [Candidatus Ichthyocystis hellenicum]|nr:hypothetical protein [Candidatus Ichthyocystis hellenicum]